MGGADDRPLGPDVFDAPQQELSEPSCLLDLSEHRLHDLLAQSVGGLEPPPAIFFRIACVNGPPALPLSAVGCLARPVAI